MEAYYIQRTERKRNNGTVMMSVYFFGEMPLILDCIQGAIPLKFGYAAGKALYIVDQRGKNEWGSGTESFPWENIYIKLNAGIGVILVGLRYRS